MTPEQQRIAIAEACGYKDVATRVTEGTVKVVTGFKNHIFDEEVPDYLNDLNAMNKAESILMHDDAHAYGCYSCELHEEYGNTVHLAAAQRAEAFLKTLGLWKP